MCMYIILYIDNREKERLCGQSYKYRSTDINILYLEVQ